MQIRRFPKSNGTQESLGPFPFPLRGIILINRTDVDVFATDDSGYEYFCPPNVIATWGAGNTTRFILRTATPVTNGEAVTFIATDEPTANSTSQLATLSGGIVLPTIVRGRVSGAGAVIAGTGFTVARTAVGRYTVTFTTAFPIAPTVLLQTNSGSNWWHALLLGVSISSFSVETGNVGAGDQDIAFSFAAIETAV